MTKHHPCLLLVRIDKGFRNSHFVMTDGTETIAAMAAAGLTAAAATGINMQA